MPARRSGRSARKPPLDVEALWAIKRIGVPTLSPDGRYACAPVTSYDVEKNEGATELWLFPTGFSGRGDGAKPRKLTAGDKDSDPRWSPDGKWIAFTAKRKDDTEPQIYLIAPDGREIALTIDPAAEPGMMNRCDIAVVSLASRRVKNLSSGSGMSDEHPRYSPDGRHIAWHAYDTARSFNDQGHLRIYERRGGRVRHLAPRFDRATQHVDWTADSRALLFLCEDRGRVGLWQLALDAEAPK